MRLWRAARWREGGRDGGREGGRGGGEGGREGRGGEGGREGGEGREGGRGGEGATGKMIYEQWCEKSGQEWVWLKKVCGLKKGRGSHLLSDRSSGGQYNLVLHQSHLYQPGGACLHGCRSEAIPLELKLSLVRQPPCLLRELQRPAVGGEGRGGREGHIGRGRYGSQREVGVGGGGGGEGGGAGLIG